MNDPGPYKRPPQTPVGCSTVEQGAVNAPLRQAGSTPAQPTIAGDARLDGHSAFTRT
jgi:hypothetical protein